MTSKFNQGEFKPRNQQKYIGKSPILWRSSWELTFMNWLDTHPSISAWASESLAIRYFNPIKRYETVYFPDFLISYTDDDGAKHTEVVEIKPASQAMSEHAKGRHGKAILAVNAAKWVAAEAWCDQRGFRFRVITESELYKNGKDMAPMYKFYEPKNPGKYVGKNPIQYHSTAQKTLMEYMDSHPSIEAWSSHSVEVPYRHPKTQRETVYLPNFLLRYVDQDGARKTEIIDIESSSSWVDSINGGKDINESIRAAKYNAATEWARSRGITFRIIKSNDIMK